MKTFECHDKGITKYVIEIPVVDELAGNPNFDLEGYLKTYAALVIQKLIRKDA